MRAGDVGIIKGGSVPHSTFQCLFAAWSDFEGQGRVSSGGVTFSGWGQNELEGPLYFAFVVKGLCVC